MMDFTAIFTRYASAQRRISSPLFFQAKGFSEACTYAEAVLRGMREADPHREYDIVSVECRAYHGTKCESGGRLWETADEFSARVAEQAGA